MKRVYRALVTATAALAVSAAPAAAAGAPEETDRAGLQERLDDVVAAGAVGALAEVRDEHGVRDTSLPGAWPRIREPHPHGYVPTLQDGEIHLLDYPGHLTRAAPPPQGFEAGPARAEADITLGNPRMRFHSCTAYRDRC